MHRKFIFGKTNTQRVLKISNELKIGVLATVAIVLFIIGYNFLKGTDVFSSTDTFYARYDEVDGLGTSNFVKIKGLNVGRVTKLVLEKGKHGEIIVEFTVDEDFKLPKGSVARIISSDLLGTKAINLELSDTNVFYANGDTLVSALQESLSKSVQAELLPVKEKAENLLSSIDSVLTIIRTIFNEETTRDIKQSVSSITSTLNHINKSAENVEGLLVQNTTRIDRIFANIESISLMLKNNEENFTAVLSNLNTITDTLAKSNLKQVIANAQNVLESTADILDKIKRGEGSMGLLMNDDKLYNNLEQSTRALDLLLTDLKENPDAYVHFSVFGNRNKNKNAATTEPKK